ncbi:unnamed protein product [Cuscuta epithymum]|uniref:RING-type domain-containing protein n=1 Tax=Cuscuta epithymum TaxID=186058 RepID=A0AAV0EEE4_9ASTE|nr:unnamed protein product [Cuscuta epithymum]
METSGGGFSRRRIHTAEYKPDSPNLGDFLRVKQASSRNGGSSNLTGLTLGAVLDREPRSSTAALPHRTLLDIIRAEPFASKASRKTWKHITDRLCLRIHGSAWSSADDDSFPAAALAADTPRRQTSHPARVSPANNSPEGETPRRGLIQPEVTTSPGSTTLIVMLQRSSSRAVGDRTSRFEVAEASDGNLPGESTTEDQPARLSLMALLAETDREMSMDSAAGIAEEEDGEAGEEIAGGGKLIVDRCCVCMVRHKGAAFIPCGHTFCRRCSRELWVQRGSCPLCNNSISEVLDIF